jgi:hypothetical protein
MSDKVKISKSVETPTTMKPKIYLDYVPQKSKLVVKNNKCKYDVDTHKWYTLDEKSKMIHDFTKKNINFWEFMNDIGVHFDKETKQWYTFQSNDSLKNFFID